MLGPVSLLHFIRNDGEIIVQRFQMMFFYLKVKWLMKDRIYLEFSSISAEPYTGFHDIFIKGEMVAKDDNLLYSVQYTNKKTPYIETLFNLMLRIRGR